MFELFLKYFMPPGMNAGESDVFRWRMMMFVLALTVVVHLVWAFGLIPGFEGVATASDVDSKIKAELQPVKDEIKTVKDQVAQNNGYLKILVSAQHAEVIRDIVRARCKSTDQLERSRLNNQLENEQHDYEKVVGSRYPDPDCEDL